MMVLLLGMLVLGISIGFAVGHARGKRKGWELAKQWPYLLRVPF